MCTQCDGHHARAEAAMERANAATGDKRAVELDAAAFHRRHLERYERAHAVERR